MIRLLLFPLRIVFLIVAALVFPRFLRWIFRLPWILYLAAAAGVGFLAFEEFQGYAADWKDADRMVRQGPPPPMRLSRWGAPNSVSPTGEVNVAGLYFSALPRGSFNSFGLERGFIMLADDQGREVKAILVVRPDDLSLLERQLTAQGNGERIPVTVNGAINLNRAWADLILTEMIVMDVPSAEELIVIEPYVGNRTMAIFERADRRIAMIMVFATLAGLLALWALIRFFVGRSERRKTASRPQQKATRRERATSQQKQTSQKVRPADDAVSASPWGASRTATPQSPDKERRLVKPQTPEQARAQAKAPVKPKTEKSRAKSKKVDKGPPQPAFESVFPGGGSGFRFKSADEIIRQTFGTLSTLQSAKRDD